MKLSSIKYYFKEAFHGLLKNRLMTIASIATVAACILIMSFSFCLVSNLQYVLSQIESSIGIAVFLEDDIAAESVSAMNEEIRKIPHVTDVTYTSPDEALAELKEEWNADDVLAGFDTDNNPLSSSFEISMDNIENQKAVLEELEKVEGIRYIRHAQTETDVLLKLNQVLSIIGILVIGVLGVISVVIIMNTIKISVYTRKTEINIMKFVGATDWFIRWPFIIEGILIGLFGAALPMLIAWPGYDKTVSMIYEYLPMIRNMATLRHGSEIFAILIPVCLIFGTGLGVTGSVSSIRKYLQV